MADMGKFNIRLEIDAFEKFKITAETEGVSQNKLFKDMQSAYMEKRAVQRRILRSNPWTQKAEQEASR